MNENLAVETIMNQFNFTDVHNAMVAVDWEWCTHSCNGAVPNVDALRGMAKYLLESLTEGDGCNETSSGAFTASRDISNGRISLKFILENVMVDIATGERVY